MAATVAKLKAQVSKLTAVAINKIQYQQGILVDCYTAAGTNSYQATPLLRFTDWTRTFGTDADDEANKNCVIRSTTVPWSFRTSEPDDRRFAIFCVSLKDEASSILNADGTLAALTQGIHYSSSEANTLLNLKFFNVHYHKRFTAGVLPMVKAASGSAGAVQNIPNVGVDTQRLGIIRLKYGKGLRIKAPAGDWKTSGHPKDPSKNYYILTFWAGDSVADLEYGQFIYSPLHMVEVSA